MPNYALPPGGTIGGLGAGEGFINNFVPKSESDIKTYFNHAITGLLKQGYPPETAKELALKRISRLEGNPQFQAAKAKFQEGMGHRGGREAFDAIMAPLQAQQQNANRGASVLNSYINSGTQPERDYIQNYLGERAGYLDPMIEEASEQFLNRTSPGLRAAMAGKGLFQSSARHQAEAQAAAAANKEVRREAAKRGIELQRQGEESYQRQFGRNLGAGQALQKAFGEEGEAVRSNAQAMQFASLRKQAEEAGDVDRAMQFAHKEQEDEQRALDMERKYEEDVRNAPVTYLQKLANVKKDMPTAPTSTSTVTVPAAPTPPNPLSLASGMLNQAMGMQQAGAHKRGGHIKGYAEGGYVGERTSEQQTMQEIAKIMNQGQGSPQGAYLRALGARQIAGSGVNGGSPLANLGIGMMEGEAAHTRQREANIHEHTQAANLHNMIENSRRDQQKMIEEREHRRAVEKHAGSELEEKKRQYDLGLKHDADILAETRRLHDSQINQHEAQAGYYRSQSGRSQSGDATINPKMLTPSDKKILEQDALTLKSAPDLLSRLEGLKELSSKINGGGVIANTPYLKDPLVSGNLPFGKIGKQADIEKFNKGVNTLVAEATAAGGARWGKAMATILEKGKPNIGLTPEANNDIFDEMIGLTRHHLESSYFGQEALDAGIHPSKAKVAFEHYKEAIRENPKAAEHITPFDFIDKAYDYSKKHKTSEEMHSSSDEDSALEREIAELERKKAAGAND